MRNIGDGTFGSIVDYEVGSWAWGVAFGDIDGDGINTRGNNQILYNDIFDNFGDGIETLGESYERVS